MKIFLYFVCIISTLYLLSFPSLAEEYVYTPDDNSPVESQLEDLMKELPDNVKDNIISPSEESIGDIAKSYNISFFLDFIRKKVIGYLPSHMNNLSTSIGIIIIVSLIKKSVHIMSTQAIMPAVDMCTSLASSLCFLTIHKSTVTSVGNFLHILSNTMLFIVPAMESIYISSGSITLASVTTTGLNLIIAFTESIFAKVLSPAISACLVLSAVSSATGNKCAVFMTKMIKGLTTGILVFIMSLITLVFTMQIKASSAADGFASRAIKFALGNYIPIVGGAVSESYSIFKVSISTLKDAIGITGIVIILLLCIGPILNLVLSKMVSFIASNTAGMLDCTTEEGLYSEINSCYSLLLAVTVASVVMYVIALSQLCISTGALI